MEFVELLKSSVDIVRVVGEYVQLRRAGGGPRYTGLCPFHNEKTPSFSVHSQHQFYKCFGCGAGGDVIKFVMEMEHLTFWEALKYLAERNGVPMPKRTEQADEETRQRAAIFEMHDLALAQFRENLRSAAGRETREYLERRGVSEKAAEEFGLGLSDRAGQALVRLFEARRFSPQDMESSGLVLKRQDGSGFFDRFRNRLMFPIHSESGKVIGFGGRALAAGDEPKYLNSAETPVYRKSYVLFNLNRARKAIQQQGFSVLVEGYMDVIGVWSAGVENVVASCGTALTPFQARAMKRHAPVVVVNYDPDNAGTQATERSAPVLLEEGLRLRVLQPGGEMDPDEFVAAHGAEAYRQALKDAPGYFHWLASRARQRFDLTSAEGRVGAFQFLLPAIHRLPDKIERLAVAEDVAAALGVEKGMVLDEFRRAAAERRETRRIEETPLPSPSELLLVQGLLADAEIRDEIAPVLRQMNVTAALRTGRIVDAILHMQAAGETPSYLAVEARLEEADRELLASVIRADELLRDTPTLDQAVAAVKTLAAAQLQASREDLLRRIREAERAGEMAKAWELSVELRNRDLGRTGRPPGKR